MMLSGFVMGRSYGYIRVEMTVMGFINRSLSVTTHGKTIETATL